MENLSFLPYFKRSGKRSLGPLLEAWFEGAWRQTTDIRDKKCYLNHIISTVAKIFNLNLIMKKLPPPPIDKSGKSRMRDVMDS